jgi:hypothetical protein
MDPNMVRGTVNMILYTIDGVADLTDQTAATRYAEDIVNQRGFHGPPSQFAGAIDAVLRDGHLSEQTLQMSQRHTEAELIEFLRRIRRELPDPA